MALLSLYSLEGRGALLTGDFDDAENLLSSVRKKLIERRCLPEATLLTIDVGMVALMTERGDEVAERIQEIQAVFERAPGFDLAMSGLSQFLEQAATGRADSEAWSCLVPTLRLAFRLQGISLWPIPFA